MYPIKLTPAFKDYLWGGQKLRTVYGKPTDLSPLAESWELSCHPDGPSIIIGGEHNGKTLEAYIRENPACLGNGYDSTELPIITIYLMYLPILIQWMRKEKDQKPLFRFVIPAVIIFLYIYGLITYSWK